ncbi:DEAD/DEAH box helicase [Mobilitalea sibirica]|uniref:DEAD/DEAH box helicase n=1 Tax=Mobilitalea sibirica TaxID=1462919 RepID=A0A8J7H195_9FIRM|nr:DEAD/DEAH box helicase [Mobilitalea sibirica]MBH1940093.1 DEAD/DEAH box helicase [Mobilitalea sibirica]
MSYLQRLLYCINHFDNSDKLISEMRNLICFLSDNENYRYNEPYRSIIFEAAQKMRTFGYIKGVNKISIDDLASNDIIDIKQQSIQSYYSSSVYPNSILDKRQKDIINLFQELHIKRLLVSAPTSFGKTFLLNEIIYLNKERYKNVLLVFPTVALLNENTERIKKLIEDRNLNYKVINNVYSDVNENDRSIFILTPERTLKILSDKKYLNIDFFFFDEMYKIDEDFNVDEETLNGDEQELQNKKNKILDNRAKAFRIALYILSREVGEYYIAGPYLNINNSKEGMKKYLKENNITCFQVDFEPTMRVEFDAWKKNTTCHHPILGLKHIDIFDNSKLKTIDKIRGVITYIVHNKLGQAILYCSKPAKTIEYSMQIIKELPNDNMIVKKYEDFINHLKKRYGVEKYLNNKRIFTTDYWSLIKILQSGYGIHHGKFPKYIQKEILNMFNNGDINFLFCTSTIIEGVNTNARNVIIINSSVGRNKLTSFALKNIKGRAGRYYHHFIGNVFYLAKEQREIENEKDRELDFSIYSNRRILDVDIDNAEFGSLSEVNKKVKKEREDILNKDKLPDYVFIKNRLYDRKLQEHYLYYLLKNDIFNQFVCIINQSTNIKFILEKKIINTILDTLVVTGIIDEYKGVYYQGVITSYSFKGIVGLLEYQLNNISQPEKQIDSIYLKVFEQIKTVVEYEVPKLLCLFEAIYSCAGEIKGYDMSGFSLSALIRFYELGVMTALGLRLVDYGYPIDTIRELERKFPLLNTMDYEQSRAFIISQKNVIKKALDNYEWNLLKLALKID